MSSGSPCSPTPGSTCAPTPAGDRGDLVDFLDTVLAAGVDIVQLREKGVEARGEIAALREVFAGRHRAPPRPAVERQRPGRHRPREHQDVLHLGQDDLPVAADRDILGDDVLIGRSTHAEAEVDAATTEAGVDYFCVGPTWPRATSPGRPAPGLPLLRHAHDTGTRPAVVRHRRHRPGSTSRSVVANGARRAVVVRAVTDAGDRRPRPYGRCAPRWSRREEAVAYVAVLAGCVAATAPLEAALGARVYRQPPALAGRARGTGGRGRRVGRRRHPGRAGGTSTPSRPPGWCCRATFRSKRRCSSSSSRPARCSPWKPSATGDRSWPIGDE